MQHELLPGGEWKKTHFYVTFLRILFTPLYGLKEREMFSPEITLQAAHYIR